MQVKLRLQRLGSNKRPFYRIIAAAATEKRDGKFLDIVGLYHPVSAEGKQIRLDEEKIKVWLSKGAQPTDTVRDILSGSSFFKEFSRQKEEKRVAAVKKRNQAAKAKKAASKASA